MPTNAPNRRPAGVHHDHRAQNPLVNHVLTGEVRWLDVPLERIVLAVRRADGHAGTFLGEDVTIDLQMAGLARHELEALTPGAEVIVKLRLPRRLPHPRPDLLSAHRVFLL